MTDLALRRGDVVVGVFTGDYGKPRPAVVVQADLFNESHDSVVVCPISSSLTGLGIFRLSVAASATNGLRSDSEVMIDEMAAVKRSRIKERIGRLSRGQISSLDDGLRLWLNLPASS